MTEEVVQHDQLRPTDEALVLHAELAALPRKYRDPLVMRYLQGDSLEQIAVALAVSSLIVKGRTTEGQTRAAGAISAARSHMAVAGSDSSRKQVAILRTACRESAELVKQACDILSSDLPPAAQSGSLIRRLTTVRGKELTMLVRVVEAIALAGAAAVLTLAVPHREAENNQQNYVAPAVLTAFVAGPTTLSYGDGVPDGKKSIAGTGEMIHFTAPATKNSLTGMAVHGAVWIPTGAEGGHQGLRPRRGRQDSATHGESSVRPLRARGIALDRAEVRSRSTCQNRSGSSSILMPRRPRESTSATIPAPAANIAHPVSPARTPKLPLSAATG